ncbi:class I SAM-dependent methyltransferase [Streptomyces sp. WMMC500]|uniref:class I SAM-dependent methyltransferase n=1 Tax=Streptomyces sp. WMMC500 TaxID=3015154 RepID=UPI00248BA9B5|nr:class I SAM-dependent methyltransferase [Streptomyces sp. WMMC500]WBB64117.1 class I SAM-dependent methyltransferase [Streptomyces sp. WMMC500]
MSNIRTIERIGRRLERAVRKSGPANGRNRRVSEVDELRGRVDAMEQELRDARVARYTQELLFGGLDGRGARMPTKGSVDTLVTQVEAATGERDARAHVVAAFRTLVEVELRGVGRIAGGTPNILGKLTVPLLLGPPNDDVLEIGTLFGLFSSALTRQFARAGRHCSLTIVDPLADVQLQPGTANTADPSGTPVSESVVRTNLELSGVPAERVRLHQGFSGDPAIRRAVSDRAYGTVIVDGDHSAEGVRADLEWVEEIVAPGGLVVVDDYGDRTWPGVKEAADEYLAGDTAFELMGVASTSAFLRRR